jgi:hypothetical protein
LQANREDLLMLIGEQATEIRMQKHQMAVLMAQMNEITQRYQELKNKYEPEEDDADDTSSQEPSGGNGIVTPDLWTPQAGEGA